MADLGRGTRYEFSADSKQFALLVGVAAIFVVIVFFSGVLVGNLIVSKQSKPTVVSETDASDSIEKRIANVDEDAILRELEGANPSYEGGATSGAEGSGAEADVSPSRVDTNAPPRGEKRDAQIIELKPPESRPSQRLSQPKKETRTLQKAKPSVTARPTMARPSSGKPAVTSRSPGSNSFAVQVAAFREKPLADRFANKLKARDYDAYVVRADLTSGMWYRVRVGSYSTEEQAQNLHARLMRSESLSGIIVREAP